MLLEAILEHIPDHHANAEDPRTISEAVAAQLQCEPDPINMAVDAVVELLELLGVIKYSGSSLKIRSQIPNYFRLSLIEFLRQKIPLLENWDREGVARAIDLHAVLSSAPYFLYAMETKRVAHLQRHGENIQPTRWQSCCIAIIKTAIDGVAVFLHKWDSAAGRFQLIGGKQRNEESPEETVIREVNEEITRHHLAYGENYTVSRLPIDEISLSGVSSTYGAYTDYLFNIFLVNLKLDKFETDVDDRWITLEEMLNQRTIDGNRVAELGSVIECLHADMLSNLPLSFNYSNSKKERLSDSIAIRPKFLFLEIDIKRLMNYFSRNR
ncbi:MAG: NUDIX hydrolase [Rhodospirillaceae bacterium]|nr:NUDIX hydrolase [Rhodospirillaceae bacterium]